MDVPLKRVFQLTGAWFLRALLVLLSSYGVGAGWGIGEESGDGVLMVTGLIGLAVMALDAFAANYNSVRRLAIALQLPAESSFLALDHAESRQRINGLWWSRKVIVNTTLMAVIVLCLAFTSCGKKDLVRLNADAISLLGAALKTSDAAYRSGFLDAEAQRGILIAGEQARKVLVEVNNFAASLPDGQLPAADEKAKILTALDAAISHLNNLVADGVLFTDVRAQRTYYRYVRPAQATVVAIKTAILKLEAAKHPDPMPIGGFGP